MNEVASNAALKGVEATESGMSFSDPGCGLSISTGSQIAERAPLGTHITELTSMIVTNAAKATVAGSTKYAEGVADQVKGEASKASGNYTEGLGGQIKGEAKKVQGQAESKAEELKQKL